MSKSITLKKLAMCSFATAAMVAGSQGAFAHTRLEIPTVLEGTSNPATHAQSNKVHNFVTIGHGCDGAATMGTSVVFPNAISYTPVIGVDSTSGKGTEKVFSSNPASDYYSPLAGIGALIRTGVWDFSGVKVDNKGNKDGFWAGGKAYDQSVSTAINVDFYTNTVTIAPASCARSVTFVLAIADFCDISVPGSAATDAQVQIWSPIPNFSGVAGYPFDATHPYSKYDGYEDAAHTIAGHGWNSPATLTVKRDLTNNPLPQGCAGNGGLGDDVYVYPSAEQINKELPVWSNPDQTGTNYWQ
jgi:hypothetical protein